jgi:ribosome-binding protein aMBF1 (putative translation factor)
MQLLTMRPAQSPAPVFKPAVQHSEIYRQRTSMPYAPTAARAAARPCAPRPAEQREDPDLPRDIASRFGRRVRELRQARSMTQVEVSVHFGIDRTFISDVERGRKAVCLPTLEVFALGFGVSLSDLMRGL